MNILIFSWRDTRHPWAGGSELNLFSQARYWVKEGNAVTVFTSSFPGALQEETIDGIQVIRRGGRFTVYLWGIVSYIRTLRKKTDCILDIMNVIPFFTPLFARKPIVVLAHHISTQQIREELMFPLSTFASWLHSRFFPWVYRSIPVIAVSESTKEELVKMGFSEKNVTIIHNGLDHKDFHPTLPKTDFPSLIYLGRLKKYKRIPLILEMFKKIEEDIPGTQLFIVGEGDEKENVREDIEKMDLKEKVTLTGWVEEKQRVDLLSQSWVYVTASMVEGWGLAVLEANACGTPAVSFDVPGLNQSIVNGTTGFCATNTEEFMEKTKKLLSGEDLRKNISNQALRWSEKYDWEGTAQHTFNMLQQSLNKK